MSAPKTPAELRAATRRAIALLGAETAWIRGLQTEGNPYWDAVEAAIDAEIAAAHAQWLECALYDATMEGPKFKGWNRSALDHLRLQQKPPSDAPEPPE